MDLMRIDVINIILINCIHTEIIKQKKQMIWPYGEICVNNYIYGWITISLLHYLPYPLCSFSLMSGYTSVLLCLHMRKVQIVKKKKNVVVILLQFFHVVLVASKWRCWILLHYFIVSWIQTCLSSLLPSSPKCVTFSIMKICPCLTSAKCILDVSILLDRFIQEMKLLKPTLRVLSEDSWMSQERDRALPHGVSLLLPPSFYVKSECEKEQFDWLSNGAVWWLFTSM